jgi:hypothetical protein
MTAAGGYAAEMRRIDEDLVKTEDAAGAALRSPERITRHVYRLYQKASIAGDLAGLTAVEHAIDDAIPLLSNPADLYLLKAHAAFKLHKLADVDSALRAVRSVYDSGEGRVIRADLDFQHGRYSAAKAAMSTCSGMSAPGVLWLGWHISAVRWAMWPTRTVFTRRQKTN